MPLDTTNTGHDVALTTQQILLNAADILEHKGLCQDAFGNEDGRVCTNTTLAMAAAGLGPNHPMTPFQAVKLVYKTRDITDAARRQIFPASAVTLWDVCDWNNHPEHTTANVVEVLRAVANKGDQ